MGTAHDHSFKWKSADHCTVVHNSLRNGKKYSENIDMTFKSESSMDLKYVEKLDGKVTVKMEGAFERTAK